MELREMSQAVFITLIFILSSFQAAYAIGENFTYDANGNMIQGPDGLYYEYNYANQLKRVRDGGPTGEVIAEYWYDHTGKRKKKNESGVVTYYWFDNFEQIYYPNGTIVNITYYSANGERLAKKVSTAAGDKMYYFHPDHLGSTSVVSDEDGNLVEETEYYPYGGVKKGGEAEKYQFTGKELDKGTGLYYYGARYYSPELTRFTQPDSIIPDPYDPQSLNRYAYVRNNPLKYVDPSGNVFVLLQGPINYKTYYTNGEKRAIVDAVKTPPAQPLSQQEYHDDLESGAKWRWGIATFNVVEMATGYGRGKIAAKLGKRAETGNKIYDMPRINDEASYEAALWFGFKFMNPKEKEKFLKTYENEDFGHPSYSTYLATRNPHKSQKDGGSGGITRMGYGGGTNAGRERTYMRAEKLRSKGYKVTITSTGLIATK